MTIFKSLKKTIAAMSHAALFAFVLATNAMAEGFGDIGNNIADNAGGVAKGAMYVGYAGGVIMVIMAIFKARESKREGGHGFGASIVMGLTGIALLSLGVVLSLGSSTLFGSDQTGDALRSLNLN